MQKAGLQLLDALQRLGTARRHFQERSRKEFTRLNGSENGRVAESETANAVEADRSDHYGSRCGWRR